MSTLTDRIARPEIAALRPYAARGGATDGAILLDANENPWAPPGAAGPWNRYPPQQPESLTARLAALYGVTSRQILLTRGADEAIDLLVRATCRPGKDAVLAAPPTFGLYALAAQVQGAKLLEVPLDSQFALQPDAIIAAAQANPVKLIFLCSPNNPTGNLADAEDVRRIARACPHSLVIVDEAYIAFAAQPGHAEDVGTLPNLAVLRTLSKAHGLAGARLGALLADAPVIALVRKILPPYPLPAPVIAAVEQALAPVNMAIFEERIARIQAERTRVSNGLCRSAHVDHVWPSAANFVLVRLRKRSGMARRLRALGIHVRDFSALGEGLVRIGIGTPEENDALLAAFGIGSQSTRPQRTATIARQSAETQVSAAVNLDAPDPVQISTGIGFYDHMLEQIARHGGFSLILQAKGDLHVDEHHTVEDCAIVLGQALRQALGDRAGIGRYGFTLPMDEAAATVCLDLSGRPALRFQAAIAPQGADGLSGEMVPHVFETLAQNLGAAIHITARGENTHHVIEAIFKGFGRALRPALARSGGAIPSTKGML